MTDSTNALDELEDHGAGCDGPLNCVCPITAADIARLTSRGDFGGWGYLGHEHRTEYTDVELAETANRLRLSIDDVFLWANSRPSRHFMDSPTFPFDPIVARDLDALHREQGAGIYRLPRVFYDDHVSRDLLAGSIIKRTKAHYYVELTVAERAELLSDARHYADPSNAWEPELRGLCSSARATVTALEAGPR